MPSGPTLRFPDDNNRGNLYPTLDNQSPTNNNSNFHYKPLNDPYKSSSQRSSK